MTIDVRGVPYFKDNVLDQVTIHLNTPETIHSFIHDVMNKALNCGEDMPPEWKELTDCIEIGKTKQDYYKQQKTKTKVIETQKVILTDPLPICEYCGQKGYGHMSNCPAIQKK